MRQLEFIPWMNAARTVAELGPHIVVGEQVFDQSLNFVGTYTDIYSLRVPCIMSMEKFSVAMVGGKAAARLKQVSRSLVRECQNGISLITSGACGTPIGEHLYDVGLRKLIPRVMNSAYYDERLYVNNRAWLGEYNSLAVVPEAEVEGTVGTMRGSAYVPSNRNWLIEVRSSTDVSITRDGVETQYDHDPVGAYTGYQMYFIDDNRYVLTSMGSSTFMLCDLREALVPSSAASHGIPIGNNIFGSIVRLRKGVPVITVIGTRNNSLTDLTTSLEMWVYDESIPFTRLRKEASSGTASVGMTGPLATSAFNAITAVVEQDEFVYMGTTTGLYRLLWDGDNWVVDLISSGFVYQLGITKAGFLCALMGDGVRFFEPDENVLLPIFTPKNVAIGETTALSFQGPAMERKIRVVDAHFEDGSRVKTVNTSSTYNLTVDGNYVEVFDA